MAGGTSTGDRSGLRGGVTRAVSLYLLFNALVLALVSASADQDQAQQLLLSQNWALGYGSQPPLYTYLVKLLFMLTGPALWPLLVLKAVLLSLLVTAVVRIGRELRFRGDQHLLALSGMALIPQFIWESQRDLTHSVLATAVAAWTLLQLLRLTRQPNPLNQLGLGALVAAGLLSKYSFAVFLASLLITAMAIPPIRRSLLRPDLALGVTTAILLLSPHLSWVLAHPEVALSGLEKTRATAALPWRGVVSALGAGIAFLSPFWVAALALLWPLRRRLHIADPARDPGTALLQRLPIALMGVLLVFVLATGATRIKDRWYQSLLFYAPISVASLAPPLPRRRLRWMVSAGIGAALTASILLPTRTTLAAFSGRTSQPNHPLPDLVRSLGERDGLPDLIVASSSPLAGNARLVYPAVPVVTPKTLAAGSSVPQLTDSRELRVLVLIDREDDPAEVLTLLDRVPGASLKASQLREQSLPERWVPGQSYLIRYAWLEPSRAGSEDAEHLQPPRR